MVDWLQHFTMRTVDHLFAIVPQTRPSQRQLNVCKIISHRGEHNTQIKENTCDAFDRILAEGIWGLECDIRWTRDLVPMIHHDVSTDRVFGQPIVIQDTSFEELRTRIPEIPTLEELIQRYGKKLHLMIEVKTEIYPEPDQQKQILRNLLQNLSAGDDYHFISLNPDMFSYVDFVPKSAMLPVSEINFSSLSEITLNRNLGGLTGHFVLLHRRLQQRHEAAGQKIGVGFPTSKNALFSVLKRDIEWVFTNDALKLKKIRNQFLKESV